MPTGRLNPDSIQGAVMSTKAAGEGADLDTIVKDIELLKKDIGRLMDRMKSDATQTVNGQAHRLYDALSAEGERAAGAIADHVEERPIASLLIAFAAGYISSRVLAR
jgi:hypothetical protein